MNNIHFYYSNETGRHIFKDDETLLLKSDLPSELQFPHSLNTAWFCVNVKFMTEDNVVEILNTLKKIAAKQIDEGRDTGILIYKDHTKSALSIKELVLSHVDKYNIKLLEFNGNESQGFPSINVENSSVDQINFTDIHSAAKLGITIKNSNVSTQVYVHNLKVEKFVLDVCRIETLEISWIKSYKWLCLHYSTINKTSLSQVETECLLLNNTLMTTACIVNITLLKRDNQPIINFYYSIANAWVIQNIFVKHEATEETEELRYDMVNLPGKYLNDIQDLQLDNLPKCYINVDDKCIIQKEADLLASLRKTFSIMKGSAEANFDFISSYGLASLEKGLKERELNVPEEKMHNLGSRLLFFLSKITSNHNQSLVRVCVMYFVNIALGTAVIYSQSLALTIAIGSCFILLSIWFYIKSQQEAMIFLLAILFLRIANTLPFLQKEGEQIGLENIVVNILLPFPSFDAKVMAYGSVVAITIFLFKIFSTYLLWQTLQTSKAQFK